MQSFDLAIIGGGIVGLATAYRFQQRFPSRSVVVLEKESSLAQHQTGHNSGVLHTGLYYPPGSLKATNCREGKLAMEAFCREEQIDFELCGKVVVAVDESELPALERIYQRGQANGVRCSLIDPDRLAELEPHAAGIRAIWVPDAGIIDYSEVCTRLGERLQEKGATIELGARVIEMRQTAQGVLLVTPSLKIQAQHVVNCAGLQCDRVAKLGGWQPTAQIIPFRGEYFQLRAESHSLVRNLIYPVPDPSFPFLGVHFTRTTGGQIECGPNAVLAFAREGYTKSTINLGDLFEVLTYPGFLKLSAKYWRIGTTEMWRSFSKRAFVRALQRLLPDISPEDLQSAPAGVRAQAIDPDGNLVDDFLIESSERVINLLNAPSPAATASLEISKQIVEVLADRFD